MKKFALAIAALAIMGSAMAQVVGKVETAKRLMGSNDAIVVESIKDPEVQGVTCHVSYAKMGGLSGDLGLAEDPSRFSIACRQTGALVLASNVKKQRSIAAFDKNIFFKEMVVTRMFDEPNSTIIYLVSSKKLLDGSPFNAISTIPLMPWGTQEPVFK